MVPIKNGNSGKGEPPHVQERIAGKGHKDESWKKWDLSGQSMAGLVGSAFQVA